MFLSKDFIDEILNVGRKGGQRGEKIYYQLKPKIRLAIIYFCYKLDARRSLPCNTPMHEHRLYAHNAHTHIPLRTTRFSVSYIFTCMHLCSDHRYRARCCQSTNRFRWYTCLNSSTCSSPQTLTLHARSFCDLLSREAFLLSNTSHVGFQ